MKTIYKIAKKELQLLFYSPVAWFMLILLILQATMVFLGKYEVLVQAIERGYRLKPISMDLFQNGLWKMVQNYMYFYIPLLTMGLISTELNQGSIKLLYSSPITNRQIILGKFLSMVAYAGVLCGVLLVYVIFAWCTIKDFEIMAVLTGLFGTFLLICTYASIGIFISSLTAYQFVAALGSFIVLAFLAWIGGLWQEYDFVRDITYWLSINGRIDTFARGLVCSEDVIYFLTVTTLFLTLTIIRLNSIRQKIPFRITLWRNVAVILTACLVGYFSSRPKLMVYYDATSNKNNTLTEVSQEVVSKLKGGLTITGYSNILDPNYPRYPFPEFIQQNRELFQRYERFKPEIKLNMVYYYDTITEQDCRWSTKALKYMWGRDTMTIRERGKKECETRKIDTSFVLGPEEISQKIDLEDEKTFVWRITRENGEGTWLRTFHDNNVYPSEAEITAALKRLTMKLPTVGFATGHGMRSIQNEQPREYYSMGGKKHRRTSLMNQGFSVVEVDLAQGIPDNVDILTLADLRDSLSPAEEAALQKFADRGGNFFILGEPKKRDVMNPFLRKFFGVEFCKGTLVQYLDARTAPDVLFAQVTPEARTLSFYNAMTDYIVMPTAAGIETVEDRGFTVIPLLKTSSIASRGRTAPVWNEVESLNWKDERLEYHPEAGEKAQDYVTAVALHRKVGDKEQRVIIAGDADCISNGEFAQERSIMNGVMYLGSYHYLSYGEIPIDVTRASTTDKEISIKRPGLNWMKIGFYGVFPLIFFASGLIIYIRRRGR